MIATVYTRPDGLGGLFIHRGAQQIGRAWPVDSDRPDGCWYGRRPKTTVQQFDSRDQAVAYVSGDQQ